MLVSRIDYNLLSDIMTFKETVKQSVEAVLDEKITASHLITDIHALMDLLDMLENQWRGTPPEDSIALAAATEAPVEQPAVEPEPVVEPETPAAEAEQPPVKAEESPNKDQQS